MTPRTLVDPNRIPRELWQYRQFLCWVYEEVPGKKANKVPINARTLGKASATYPNTWCDIYTAVAAYKRNPHLSGIGFVVTANDPYVIADLDDCLIGEQVSPYAGEIVDTLGTYTEKSPSLYGLRALVRSTKLPTSRKTGGFELYSTKRFATLTGNVFRGNPIAEFDDLEWLIDRFAPRTAPPTIENKTTRSTPTANDDLLWAEIFHRNPLAKQLYNDDLSRVNTHRGTWGDAHDNRPDQSTAVCLLLNCLAHWTGGDAARMRRMMEQTKLDKTKWNADRSNDAHPGRDWLALSIDNAISYMRGAR